jgi:hypothetical protein
MQDVSEPPALLVHRLSGFANAISNTLPANALPSLQLADNLVPDSSHIFWYTDHPEVARSLPASVRDRLIIRSVGQTAFNAAIVNASFVPDMDDTATGTLVVRVAQPNRPPDFAPPSIEITGGSGGVRTAIAAELDGSDAIARFAKIKADGDQLHLRLINGGAASGDDDLSIRLPLRPMMHFSIHGALPQALITALQSIGKIDSDPGAIQCISGAAVITQEGPWIQIVSGRGAPKSTVTVHRDNELSHDLNLEDAVTGDGVDLKQMLIESSQSEWEPLLSGGDTILAAVNTAHSHLLLSDALFSQGSVVSQRPAFFVLLTRVCRAMSGYNPGSLVITTTRFEKDPLLHAQGSVSLAADRAAVDLTVAGTTNVSPLKARYPFAGITTLCILGAIALLLLDSWMHATGRTV